MFLAITASTVVYGVCQPLQPLPAPLGLILCVSVPLIHRPLLFILFIAVAGMVFVSGVGARPWKAHRVCVCAYSWMYACGYMATLSMQWYVSSQAMHMHPS